MGILKAAKSLFKGAKKVLKVTRIFKFLKNINQIDLDLLNIKKPKNY